MPYVCHIPHIHVKPKRVEKNRRNADFYRLFCVSRQKLAKAPLPHRGREAAPAKAGGGERSEPGEGLSAGTTLTLPTLRVGSLLSRGAGEGLYVVNARRPSCRRRRFRRPAGRRARRPGRRRSP